jgi:hypothetical protein
VGFSSLEVVMQFGAFLLEEVKKDKKKLSLNFSLQKNIDNHD